MLASLPLQKLLLILVFFKCVTKTKNSMYQITNYTKESQVNRLGALRR